MKNKNHFIVKYAFLFILLTAFSSCVSTKRYDLALSQIESLKADSVILANRLDGANDQWIDIVQNKNRTIEEQVATLDSLLAISKLQRNQLNEIEMNLRRAFPSFTSEEISTFIDQGYVQLSLDHRVLFNRGENDLSDRGTKVIASIVSELNKLNNDVMIIGHTDSIPFYSTERDNWQLSFDRAHAVMQKMTQSGLSADRIIVAGRGKTDPFITNEHQIGRLLNRRIEIVLMPNLAHVESIMAEIDE